MGCKIKVTPLGVKDLEEIVPYMTQELDNANAAASFLDEVDVCYARMEEMPFLFEECHDPRLKALQYRRAIIKHYVMVYRVDEAEKTIYVLRFFYGARDYEKLI
mgnify:FL=1